MGDMLRDDMQGADEGELMSPDQCATRTGTSVTTAPLGNKGAPQTGAQGGRHRYMISEPPQPRRFKVGNSRGAHRKSNARGWRAEARACPETTIRFYRVCTACCHHAGQGPGLLSGGLAGEYTPALHRIGEGPQCIEPRQNRWRGDNTARTSIFSSPIPRALGMKAVLTLSLPRNALC